MGVGGADMLLKDGAALGALLTPVVRYFYPLPDSIPSGASFHENIPLDKSLVFTFKGPPLDVFFGKPEVTRPLLQRVQEVLKDRLRGRWALQVTFYDNNGELPHPRQVGRQISPILQKFKATDANNLADATRHCVDLQFGFCQTEAHLFRLQNAESSMDGQLGFPDLVDYEISKSFDQARHAPLISEILGIHYHRTMETEGEEHLDNLLAGFQTAGLLVNPDNYSAVTLALASELQLLATMQAKELAPLLDKKKSHCRFHLLSVEEGIAELHAFVATRYVVEGNIHHYTMDPDPSGKEKFLKRYSPSVIPQNDPHSRGLKLFSDIFERHGYTFCHLSAWLCKMHFQKMRNLLPMRILKTAREANFPFHPNTLLNRLSRFEFEHPNACAKLAPAIAYLGLDVASAEETALQLLKGDAANEHTN